jgi:CARDB
LTPHPEDPVSRLRPTRTHILLGLVVVLLATIPVAIPLLVTNPGGRQPEQVRLASGPGEPAMPQGGPVATPSADSPAPPPAAGALVPTVPRPTTPSRAGGTTTQAPPSVPSTAAASTSAAPPPAPAPDPTTAGPTSASPTAEAEVLADGVDLQVVQVSWSPEPTASGQPVVFSAVVRNTGAEATPALPTGVAFSVDGSVVSWSASDSTPLGPGEQRTFTADDGVAGAAWTAADGEHTVQATVDDTGQIPEVDEGDNTATAQLAVP